MSSLSIPSSALDDKVSSEKKDFTRFRAAVNALTDLGGQTSSAKAPEAPTFSFEDAAIIYHTMLYARLGYSSNWRLTVDMAHLTPASRCDLVGFITEDSALNGKAIVPQVHSFDIIWFPNFSYLQAPRYKHMRLYYAQYGMQLVVSELMGVKPTKKRFSGRMFYADETVLKRPAVKSGPLPQGLPRHDIDNF